MLSDRPSSRWIRRRLTSVRSGALVVAVATSWLAIGAAFGLGACTAPVPGPDADAAQAGGNWAGLYRGVLPCADCEGIDTLLELHDDGTWERTLRYLGASDEPIRSSGRIAFAEHSESSGAGVDEVLLFLEPGTTERTAYRVEADALRQLDRERQVIEGDLAARYRLARIGSGTDDPRRLDGEWWITALDGEAVEADRTRRRRPHLRFDFVAGRLSFTGGCNQFAGALEFPSPGRIAMAGPFAGTRMMCPGRVDLDQELTDALQAVRAWRIGDGSPGDVAALDLLAEPDGEPTIRLMRPSPQGAGAAVDEEGEENP